jgi:hypothetical protein
VVQESAADCSKAASFIAAAADEAAAQAPVTDGTQLTEVYCCNELQQLWASDFDGKLSVHMVSEPPGSVEEGEDPQPGIDFPWVGQDEMDIILGALKETTLVHTLVLEGVNFDHECYKLPAVSLGAAIEKCTSLRELVLRRNHMVPSCYGGSKAADAIGTSLTKNTSLHSLCIEHDAFGDCGAVTLGASLKTNEVLRKLVLRSTQIGSDGGVALGNGLASNSSLEELDLDHNNIGNDGAISLAKALKINTTLLVLRLHNNSIGEDGACALGQGLRENDSTSLRLLDLGGNSSPFDGLSFSDGTRDNYIGCRGASAIAAALPFNRTISTLKYASYPPTATFCCVCAATAETQHVREVDRFRFTLQPLCSLSGCIIGTKGGQSLADALKDNTAITDIE